MIYCCKISNDPDISAHAFQLCSPDRRKKAEQLKNTKARDLSISAGLLLRYCLLKKGRDGKDIGYSQRGKPFIKDDNLFFSLSHSGEYAACITSQKPIGIDIQKIVDINERTVRRFCTDKELLSIQRSDYPKKTAVIFWALKESYLKASECSTSEAFAAEFSVCHDSVKGPKGYSFDVLENIEGYIVAVCEAK